MGERRILMAVKNPPHSWIDETSGVLRPAVMAYLKGLPLTLEHISALRAYLRQWIMSEVWDQNPHAGPEQMVWLAEQRARTELLTDRHTISRWIDGLVENGMDPL